MVFQYFISKLDSSCKVIDELDRKYWEERRVSSSIPSTYDDLKEVNEQESVTTADLEESRLRKRNKVLSEEEFPEAKDKNRDE
jgi:hypothetical protein